MTDNTILDYLWSRIDELNSTTTFSEYDQAIVDGRIQELEYLIDHITDEGN